jgi:hypothetical protein
LLYYKLLLLQRQVLLFVLLPLMFLLPPQDVLQMIEPIVRGMLFSTMLRSFPCLWINIIRLAYAAFGSVLLTSVMLKKIRNI